MGWGLGMRGWGLRGQYPLSTPIVTSCRSQIPDSCMSGCTNTCTELNLYKNKNYGKLAIPHNTYGKTYSEMLFAFIYKYYIYYNQI